jgi:HEAT repeat protein
MTSVVQYREQLRAENDWRAFLLANSRLPGPRSNLELAQAFAEEASPELAREYANIGPDAAPENTPEGFLACCGVIGLGRLAADGDTTAVRTLRARASDPRWRVRESVAMALQRVGDADMDRLLDTAQDWARGNLLERRAAVAAVSEPRLLRRAEVASRVLALLDTITGSVTSTDDRRAEPFRVLRQTMAYCWSVVVAAYPEQGKAAFGRWLSTTDPDVRLILRENL